MIRRAMQAMRPGLVACVLVLGAPALAAEPPTPFQGTPGHLHQGSPLDAATMGPILQTLGGER